MKTQFLIVLALTLVGCSTRGAHTTTLTPEQASRLARQLANEQAQVLYQCQPFHNGPAPRLVQGYWVWHDRQGQGQADVEATVKFAPDGTKPSVAVVLLDSRPELPKRFRSR